MKAVKQLPRVRVTNLGTEHHQWADVLECDGKSMTVKVRLVVGGTIHDVKPTSIIGMQLSDDMALLFLPLSGVFVDRE